MYAREVVGGTSIALIIRPEDVLRHALYHDKPAIK